MQGSDTLPLTSRALVGFHPAVYRCAGWSCGGTVSSDQSRGKDRPSERQRTSVPGRASLNIDLFLFVLLSLSRCFSFQSLGMIHLVEAQVQRLLMTRFLTLCFIAGLDPAVHRNPEGSCGCNVSPAQSRRRYRPAGQARTATRESKRVIAIFFFRRASISLFCCLFLLYFQPRVIGCASPVRLLGFFLTSFISSRAGPHCTLLL